MSEPVVSHDPVWNRSNSARNGTTVTDQAEPYIHPVRPRSTSAHVIARYTPANSHSQTPRQSAMPYLVQHPVQRQARFTVHHHPNPSNTPVQNMTGHPATIGYVGGQSYADRLHNYQHYPHAIQSVYMNSNYNRALRAHQQLDHERQRMQAYQAYLDMNRPRQARNGSRSSPDMTMNPNSSPQPIPMQMYAVSQPPPQQLAQPLLHHHHHHHQHLPPNPMPVTHSHPTLPQMFPGYGYLPFAFPINSMIAPQTRFAGQPATDSQPMNQVYFNLLRDSMHQGVHQYHDLDLPLQEESQGVSEERIRECTTEFKFKQNDIADEQEPDQCSICLSKYKLNERVRQLPCQHRFHVSCVDLWLTKSTICPYCRFTLKAERQQRP